jgi:hypothetical protein
VVLEITGDFMKTNKFPKMLAVMAAVGLACSASTVRAQDPSAPNPAPQLSYGVPQVIQLAQAKVGDDTIIAYIKNTGNSYGLNADQIIYLRQQGVSDAVITVMLNQPRAGVFTAPPAMSASQPAASPAYQEQVSTATVAPTVTYVQTVPYSTYYYQPYYYYPSYAWYPPVSFSFGWGGVWGGGWHGGGWRGGGISGGWHGGGVSSGWHGSAPSGGGHFGGHR